MALSKVIATDSKRVVKVNDICKSHNSLVIYDAPFKIRVTNITVPGYSPTNVPPIGIALIGINNYIL